MAGQCRVYPTGVEGKVWRWACTGDLRLTGNMRFSWNSRSVSPRLQLLCVHLILCSHEGGAFWKQSARKLYAVLERDVHQARSAPKSKERKFAGITITLDNNGDDDFDIHS